MNRIVILITCLLSLSGASLVHAQSPSTVPVRPQRTPEEIARKQTEMLARELLLTDSLQRDSIYHIHLRYVQLRMSGSTRAEEISRTQHYYDELRLVLTAEQYEAFMNKPLAPGPRLPQGGAIVGTSPGPRGHRPADLPEYPRDNEHPDTSESNN